MTQLQTQAQTLAQHLFDKAIKKLKLVHSPTDEVAKAKGIEIASIMLNEIYGRNSGGTKNDLYCETHAILVSGDVEY